MNRTYEDKKLRGGFDVPYDAYFMPFLIELDQQVVFSIFLSGYLMENGKATAFI